MITHFLLGNLVRLSATFVNAAGAPVDPGFIILTIKLPDCSTETLTYANGDIIKDGIGLYHYDFLTTEAGLHYYLYDATGDVIAASQGQFAVDPVNTLDCAC
jgi:hypothetical protein